MAENKIKRENFIVLQGWMITDLHLKGNELIVYAIIYGFSQDGGQYFSGSLQYLASWTNSTRQGVLSCLKSLLKKGLIEKKETIINNVKFCEYRSTKFNGVLNKVDWGVKQSLTGGVKQSLTNNIDIYNIEHNIEDNIEGATKCEEKINYDTIVKEYNHLCFSLPPVRTLSTIRVKAIRTILKQYSIEQIYEVFRKVERSNFLKGKNERKWRANFDWIMKETNFIKILEGNYDECDYSGSTDNVYSDPLDGIYE